MGFCCRGGIYPARGRGECSPASLVLSFINCALPQNNGAWDAPYLHRVVATPRPARPRRRANDPLKADVGQPQSDQGREVPDDFGRLDAEAADLVEELQFEFDHPRDNQIVILDGLGRGLAQTISERVIKPDDDMRIEIG